MKFHIINILLILSFGWQVSASETVLDSREQASYIVDYSGSGRHEKSVNNFFIRELAKYNLTSLYNTSFTYHYTIRKSLQKIESYTYKVKIEITVDHCSGNIYYRDFDLSDILKPEWADLTIVIDAGGNYIHTEDFQAVNRTGPDEFNVEFTFETFEPDQNPIVRITDNSFYSDEQDKAFFYERISNIDNYYAAIAAADISIQHLDDLDLSVSDPVTSLIRIGESHRIYKKISTSGFIDKLNLTPENKPVFFEKIGELRNKISSMSYYYESLLERSGFIRLSVGIQEVAETFVEETSRFYYLSQEATHTHQPYYYNLGIFSSKGADFYLFKKGLNQIIRKTKFCNDTDAIADKLKSEIYKAYMNKAGDLIDGQYYYLARGLLENARLFYIATINRQLPVTFNIVWAKVSYGIYNSYLHLIDRAIDIGNYELAENYIGKARDFQESNSTTIISDKYIHSVSEKLVKLYISKGIRQNQNEEFEEAIYCFEQAHSVCSNLGVFNHDYIIKHGLIQARNGFYNQLLASAEEKLDEGEESKAYSFIKKANDIAGQYNLEPDTAGNFDYIQSRYHQQVYLNLISAGRKYLQAGNYTMAYRQLLDALELEAEYRLDIYQPLPDLFAKAAIPYLADQCKLGEVKVKKSKMDEARHIYDQCLALQSEYGLQFEPKLTAGLTMLNNSIFSKQCLLVAQKYEEQVRESYNQADGGDYISAVRLLKETESMLKKNYFCEYDNTTIAGLLKEYEPAAEYQRLAGEAQDALSKKDNDRFVKIYKKMEELSNLYEVIRTRIEPMPLHYLFSVKKNLALLESTITGYESEEEYSTALKILHVLEANNTSGREARNIQQKLAEKIAKADKATASLDDPRQNVEQYTGGNSWYRYFKKTYIKHWQE